MDQTSQLCHCNTVSIGGLLFLFDQALTYCPQEFDGHQSKTLCMKQWVGNT
jgi:hypothetical protein